MTTSAIRFNGHSVFVADAELREWIKALAWSLPSFVSGEAGSDGAWLLQACNEWINDHENLPPGLRDIELDEVLSTTERVDDFRGYLLSLPDSEAGGHGYDAKTAHSVVGKVVHELLR
ncbi:hypothetical protein [Lysobacter enzymogenes]|uniref:Uncharacterized protein n=1 Tax=Lysobacter enzymogenes TaxID=69 RepID=A0A3N2RJW7_LYSEN|nr:hypothetical protein [Lysobacter enzymogenes]ROU07770.1 hypothetical protein D9T17_06060 [Lysobacter enzymogenes]